jgi:hypothetical protein
MRTEYCSTCLAPVAINDGSCTQCGFSIIALPTSAAPKQRDSLLLWVIIIGAPILTLLYSVGRFEQRLTGAAGTVHQATEDAPRQLQRALTNSLSTPAAFIAKRGKPAHQTQGPAHRISGTPTSTAAPIEP